MDDDEKEEKSLLETAYEKTLPYLEAAKKISLDFRPITGLMQRIGDQIGVDIAAAGEVVFADGMKRTPCPTRNTTTIS